jgi:flagellar protein FliO/FliZ
MVELVVRLVFSLAVIVGMLLMLARFSAKRFRGTSGSLVRVVHRQPLSRTSALAIVTVGSRVLVLGTTEQQVQLLTELDPEDVEMLAGPAFDAALDDALEATAGSVSSDPATTSPVLAIVPGSDYTPRHAAALRDAGPGDLAVQGPRADAAAAARTAAALRAAGATRAARIADGALAGSLLSAQTWKQAFAAATSRTRDAS